MLKNIILSNGYIEKGYGYYKETNVGDEDEICIISHWITLFGENELKMYSYYKEESEGDKIYDTSIIKVTSTQLQVLIDVFIK